MKKSIIAITLFLTFSFSIRAQLDSLIAISDTIPTMEKKVDWMVGIAYDYYTIDPNLTEKMGLLALNLASENNYEFGIARSHHILGIAYWTQGLLEKGLKENLAAQEIYERLGEDRWLRIIIMNSANIYGNLNQHDKAIDKLKSVIELAEIEQDSQLLAWTYNNIGTEYRKLGDFDSALIYLKKDLPYIQALMDTVGLALVNNNIAVAYNSRGEYNEAIKHLALAREQLRLKESKKRLAEVYTNFASNYAELGQLEKDKAYLDSAQEIAADINAKRIEQEILLGLSDYYSRIEDHKASLDFYHKHIQIKDSISSAEVQKETEILQLKYEDEKKANQLAQLENQQIQDRFDYWLLFIISTAVLLLASLMIYTLRLRVKNARMTEKELQSQVEQKNKELTSYALNFIQKNELLNELTEKIAELKKQSDTRSIKELNQMNGIINNSFRIDHDWDNFKLMFEELHGDFFVRLKDRFPDLGNAELKLCALLRLNMNLKESSRILGISSDSVKTARYRIRKKFGLATEDNLVDFLIKFDSEGQHLAIA
ncbi:MAG: tetratricopeptide repeat protein [Reichenbachiella sp.]|uniref:tetratricopeptide repeat protein n=1 Tax=Reichenbachiella sp. TaxID=2184521 RepID=UPI00296778DB|nr:tetratricopeptide repeat protein [Reichenbachiella sp.]MDW3210713.1 tetratricopeptide repeat protein [Reichenbachiella sp.]